MAALEGRTDGAGGAAGGDLTGTYPNPLIAANAVDSTNIADGSVGGADVEESDLDSSILQFRDPTAFCGTGRAVSFLLEDGSLACNDFALPSGVGLDSDGCALPTSTPTNCVSANVTSNATGVRSVLVLATGVSSVLQFDDPGSGGDATTSVDGSCRIRRDTTEIGTTASLTEVQGGSSSNPGGLDPSSGPKNFSVFAIDGIPVSTARTYHLTCTEDDGNISIGVSSITAIVLGS